MIDLQEKVRAFNDARRWQSYHSPRLLAGKIIIEAAELLECFEWDNRITPFDQSATEKELADVLICCLSMANALGVDAMQIVERKLAINAAKYPIVDSGSQQKTTTNSGN